MTGTCEVLSQKEIAFYKMLFLRITIIHVFIEFVNYLAQEAALEEAIPI